MLHTRMHCAQTWREGPGGSCHFRAWPGCLHETSHLHCAQTGTLQAQIAEDADGVPSKGHRSLNTAQTQLRMSTAWIKAQAGKLQAQQQAKNEQQIQQLLKDMSKLDECAFARRTGCQCPGIREHPVPWEQCFVLMHRLIHSCSS
jgi:hypothetical protein